MNPFPMTVNRHIQQPAGETSDYEPKERVACAQATAHTNMTAWWATVGFLLCGLWLLQLLLLWDQVTSVQYGDHMAQEEQVLTGKEVEQPEGGRERTVMFCPTGKVKRSHRNKLNQNKVSHLSCSLDAPLLQ
ncbi:hypothetical protein INR49_026926 [Caranx melampygus]|nr:hypothetical protein INR49_026926 [Caranx melampygus]